MHTKHYSNVHVLQVTFGQKSSWHSATSICARPGRERFKHSISPETIVTSNPRWLRLVFALPSLYADSIWECFLLTLTDLMPDTTEANLFADYIYGTYIHQDCSYPPIMWADILCRNVKTTNACEAFHRHFQSSLQTYHPNIFKIEQVSNNELKGHYQRGKRYASKEEQRASVAEKYKHGEIDIVGYLFKMSKVMQPARGCRIF